MSHLNMDTPTENNALATVENETPHKRRRKKKSMVWEFFFIEQLGDGSRRACCKTCKQSFAYSNGSKVAGTSHLKRHIAKGTCQTLLRNQQRNQLTPNSAPSEMGTTDPPKRRYRTSAAAFLGADPDSCSRDIAKMIIMHDYPLHMVQDSGFLDFVHSLQPQYDLGSFSSVQGDCVATYLQEKQSIQKMIDGIPGRICLTLDLWTSPQNIGFLFITGQFIDHDWKLHRKLLSFVMEPFLDSDSAFSHAVASCLFDWNMEGRLFSVTINQTLSIAATDNLRAMTLVKDPEILNGQLLVKNCLARTLSSIAKQALVAGEETVKKIRDSVKYVKTSETHEGKFLEIKQQLQVPSTKTISLDDQTRWDTTYEMLVAASELKEAFSCLDTSHLNYQAAPSMEIWKQVDTLCFYLKPIFDTDTILSNPVIQTTNIFFHEMWKIHLDLARGVSSEDTFVRSLTKSMKEKFDEYWRECSLVLAIAVIMDPRFKMKLVEFSFTRIYGTDAATYVKLVDDGIHDLFLEYDALPLLSTPGFANNSNGADIKPDGTQKRGRLDDELGLTDFDMYMMESTSHESRSELDQYLEESLLPRVQEFDVLGWWKLNKTKYPTLSKMARDILTIPLCTVAPDSVFDIAGKEMDNYRSSLRPETLEALVCAKEWLKYEPLETQNALVKMEFPI